MLACDQTITIIRCNGTTYSAEVCTGCSWFTKTIGTMTDRGLQMGREIKVRIPEAKTPAMYPVVGDYVVKGAVSGVSKLSDLNGKDFGKITNVGDNRRGRLPHTAVVAS